MQKLKFSSDGFHVFPAVAVLLVVGMIGLVGFRVFHLQSNSTTEGQGLGGTSRQVAVQVAPPTWKVFADKDIGVQFVYPQEFGVFTEGPAGGSYEAVRTSARVSTSTMPGVSGAFSLKSYKKGVMETTPRRYGPTVELTGDGWVVTKPSELDSRQYKKGDVYTELTRTNLHGLEVYSIETADEGIMSYALYFTTGGRLQVLEFPPFDSEQYSSTYNINDRGPYDAMYRQVLDSVRLY